MNKNENLIQQTIKRLSQNKRWWGFSEKEVVGKYGKMFAPDNLNKLTKENFKSFLLFENNYHWSGIHRQGNIITSDMSKLKRVLRYLQDEKYPIQKRLNDVLTPNGKYAIKGLGKAVITPVLLVTNPKKYGVWNTPSEAGLKKLNLFPKFNRKDTFAERYIKVNNVLLDLAYQYNITLWQLDGVLGDISSDSPASLDIENFKLEETAYEEGIEDIGIFGMERHLEDFLITNWERTVFGKNYELIYEEGDLVSQQYPTDVGPIDILAKSKDDKGYLVIELKKSRTSDAVVGQLLRYKNWVKKNLAQKKNVCGAVVVLDSDEKLDYSIMGLKDVSLYTYEVKFNLKKRD